MTVVRSYPKFLLGALISITFLFVMYLPILPPTPWYNRNIDVIGWEVNISRNTSLYVRPYEETVLMSGAKVCPPPPLLLYIVVCSALGNGEARSAIRDTWARNLPPATAVVFFMGRSENETVMESVQEEQMTYQDLVQEDFIDSYNNLTISSIMMLKFSLQHCSHFRYLVKTDDDVYLNVHKLFDQLTSGKMVELVGLLNNKGGPVIRNPYRKWYTPEYMFSEEVYPPYLEGCMYIMSRKVATTLYNVSLQIPYLHHEDVFITGICASVAGLKPRRLVGILPYFENFYLCNSSFILVHRLSPENLRRFWKPTEGDMCNLTMLG